MNHNFYIIYTGETDFFSKGDKIGKFTKGQFIGEMLASSGFINTNLIVATEPTILLSLNKELFYDLLSDNVKLADKILEFI